MNEVCCKWASEDMRTMNDTKWEVGIPNELPEEDNLELCKEGLFHYYEHPLIAFLFKDHHVPTTYTKLYKVKPEGKIVKDITKCGSTKLTLIEELEIPKITSDQKIAFGILWPWRFIKRKSLLIGPTIG